MAILNPIEPSTQSLRHRFNLAALHSSNTRLIAVVFGAMILLVIYFIANSYYDSLEKSKEEVLQRLMAIVFTSARLVDGEAHDSLATQLMKKDAITQNNQNPTYNKLHQTLKAVHETNHLMSPLYTIVFYPNDSTFHFIGTSSPTPYYRHNYRNYPHALIDQFETGGVLDVYEDENGVWLSAFAPIKNKAGKTVALLEADQHFEFFMDAAIKDLWSNSIISLLIVLPFGFILFRYLSGTLKKQEEVQLQLQEQNEEIQTQNEVIKRSNLQLEEARKIIEAQNHVLEEKVLARTKELEETNKELSKFLYHSSHDVQAPVATLKGLHQLALLETADEKAQHYLKLMQETVTKLDRMVKTIQAIHQVRTSPVQMTPVNLWEMVNSIFQLFLRECGSKFSYRILIERDKAVYSDSTLLHLVLLELIRNAIQYHRFDMQEEHRVEVSARWEKEFVHLIIEDNGCGIEPSIEPTIFAMFKRGHARSSGMGMGLNIAKMGLQRIKGNLELLTKENYGTKFLVRLSA